eukprot:360261-Chlamydomonas_euryale.AAC.2
MAAAAPAAAACHGAADRRLLLLHVSRHLSDMGGAPVTQARPVRRRLCLCRGGAPRMFSSAGPGPLSGRNVTAAAAAAGAVRRHAERG